MPADLVGETLPSVHIKWYQGLNFLSTTGFTSGRFVSVHVKDEIKVPIGEMNDQHDSTILGNGLVDPKAVCLLAKAIGGTKHFIIEQESYQGIAPLECARINLERIKTWGLV